MAEKKKLFVSVPMKERMEPDIRNSITKMHKMAELVLGEEFDLIESYIEGNNNPSDNREAVRYLGKSIELLAEADYVIGLAEIDTLNSNGCLIEREVALRYGIPYIRAFAEQVAPDIIMAMQAAQQRQQQNENINLEELM